MTFFSYDCRGIPASVHISRFQGQGGVDEFHITVRPTEYATTEVQLEWISRAYLNALDSMGLSRETAVFRRFFCSDLLNQSAALEGYELSNPRNEEDPCAVSWVCQPPVPPVKVAVWAHHIADAAGDLDKTQYGTSMTLKRGPLSHHWTTGLTCSETESSYDQTRDILDKYDGLLRMWDLTLVDNVIRTWFFVRDVDSNYNGLVVARREIFTDQGLTPDTHYIASTGIEGASADLAAKVALDSYAISGVQPEQIEYLHALDHLSHTHVYGVTFERATSVAYRDRKHIFISGTASIDRDGEIVHPGNVSKQLDRTLENMGALLAQAGASLDDMAVFVSYVRDPSDHALVWRRMQERFGNAPIEVVVAPVCRPGWLVELEGMAVIPDDNPELPAF
ncbi:MAG: translation initiation inhibitor [bacterium]|nr:translation initiation inhibitor [bacterium]